MKLTDDEALARLTAHDHGVLCTVHAERGVDAVPVVYTVGAERTIGIPIDEVKPKASTRLQRVRNLETDPRATLLIEHWDRDDWSKLWWVRAELRWSGHVDDNGAEPFATRLAERFAQYRDRPFAEVVVLHIVAVTGWSASPPGD